MWITLLRPTIDGLVPECYENYEGRQFFLRSGNSNSAVLAARMRADNNFVTHDSSFEKVLEYIYDTVNDDLYVAINSTRVAADTKRGILSQNSSVFDPLGLCTPVTVKERTLVNEIWKRKLSWDQNILLDLQLIWDNLYQDLERLQCLGFPRFVLNSPTSTPTSAPLIVFYDASQRVCSQHLPALVCKFSTCQC